MSLQYSNEIKSLLHGISIDICNLLQNLYLYDFNNVPLLFNTLWSIKNQNITDFIIIISNHSRIMTSVSGTRLWLQLTFNE